MPGFKIQIGADISGFEKGQRDVLSSAKRGAQEIGTAYITSGAVAKAAMQSTAITFTAMQVASGNVASMMSGALKVGAIDGFGAVKDGATSGIASVDTLSEKLALLPKPVAAVIEGFAAFQAVTRVWQAFNEALEDTEVRMARLNNISRVARELGTGPTFLTSLIAQAKQLGVETETLTGMLTRAREASRVQIGVGKDAVNESTFQSRLRQNVMAGNLSQADVAPYNDAKTQEAQIRAVLDLLDKLKASNREIAANDLGRTFFGADFEAKTRQGINLVEAFRNALDGAKVAGGGLAPTPEELARAQEFAQREEAIAATIRDAIAPAVRDFNELSDAGKRTWIEWEERVAGWVKWLGEGYLKIRDVAAQVRQMAADWGLIGQPPAPAGQNDGDPLVVRVRPRAKPADQSKPLPSLSSGSARAPRDAQDPDSVANVIRQLEKARDIAEAELKTVGLSNAARQRAIDIAKAEAAARADVEKGVRASATLTAEETNRINAAADATANFKDRQKDLEQQLQQNADLARYFGNTLAGAIGDAVIEGRSLNDVLKNISSLLSRGVLSAIFTGQGPLAGLLGMAPAASEGSMGVGGIAGMLSKGVSSLFSGGGSGSLAAADSVALAGVPMFATGVTALGIIEGPGTGTSDSILARVSKGESIVNAEATADHLPIVQAINSGATREELERLIHPDPKVATEAPERAEAITREAQRIVYRDRLEAAGVAADAIPSAPKNPTPELRAAVRAVVVTRLRTELTSAMGEEATPSGSRRSDGSAPTMPHIRQALDLRMPELPPAVLDRKGFLTGPGSGTSDSILARVSDGEAIVKASATARHRPLIEAMNADRLPAFARGGMISDAVGSMSLPAGGYVREDTGHAYAAANAAGPQKSELHIHGGAPETKAETSAGPRGPRTEIWLDRSVAATLQTGSQTRSTLKQIGGGKMVGG